MDYPKNWMKADRFSIDDSPIMCVSHFIGTLSSVAFHTKSGNFEALCTKGVVVIVPFIQFYFGFLTMAQTY